MCRFIVVSWFRVAADPRSSERNQILELRSGSVKVKRNRKLGGGVSDTEVLF